MKIIEKDSGKVIVIIDRDIIRVLDAVNYELIKDGEDKEDGDY